MQLARQRRLQCRRIDHRRILPVGAPQEVNWATQLRRERAQPLGPRRVLGSADDSRVRAGPARARQRRARFQRNIFSKGEAKSACAQTACICYKICIPSWRALKCYQQRSSACPSYTNARTCGVAARRGKQGWSPRAQSASALPPRPAAGPSARGLAAESRAAARRRLRGRCRAQRATPARFISVACAAHCGTNERNCKQRPAQIKAGRHHAVATASTNISASVRQRRGRCRRVSPRAQRACSARAPASAAAPRPCQTTRGCAARRSWKCQVVGARGTTPHAAGAHRLAQR